MIFALNCEQTQDDISSRCSLLLRVDICIAFTNFFAEFLMNSDYAKKYFDFYCLISWFLTQGLTQDAA